jgi:hypothetical protein
MVPLQVAATQSSSKSTPTLCLRKPGSHVRKVGMGSPLFKGPLPHPTTSGTCLNYSWKITPFTRMLLLFVTLRGGEGGQVLVS